MQSNSSSSWKFFILAAAATLLAGGAQAQLDAPHNFATATGCLSCHQMTSTSPNLLLPPDHTPLAGDIDDTVSNNLCWSCHTGTGGTDEPLHVPTHSSRETDESYGNWTVECWVCHNQHAQEQFRKYGAASYVYTGNYAGVDNTGANAIISVTGAAMTPDQFAGYIVVPNTARANYNYKIIGNTAATLTVKGLVNTTYAVAGNPLGISYGKFIRAAINLSNIGKPAESKTVRFFKQTGPNSFADGDPAAIDGICEVCHTDTSAWHNDGTLAGVAAHSGLKASNCITCHPHAEGFRAVYECLDCHDDPINNRAAVGQQFGGNSHHVQTGSTITSDKCYQCHWEADGGGKLTSHHSAMPGAAVDLVIYGAGTRPETYTAGSTAVAYTGDGSRGQILSLNDHCLGCHSDQNNAIQPFGDGKTPKQYAWDGSSVATRYSQTGTTPWGKYSSTTYPNVTPKDRRTKAFSAHGNAVNNEGGWDLSENWPNTRNGGMNVACFDCHNSHGSTVEGTTTSYASTTTNGGILKETSAGIGGYSVTYKPTAGGSAENMNLRNAGSGLCFDCHLNANGSTAALPWGYQTTFGASQAIIGFFDSAYLAPGQSGSQQRYSYKGLDTNAGGHFGASSALNSSPLHAINGLCTPCHDPHGVSPAMGANQQYGVPLLKGTWVTAPYQEDVAPAYNGAVTYPYGNTGYHIDQNTFGPDIIGAVTGVTQPDTQFAGLCLSCHPKNSLTDGANGGAWKSMDRIHESVKGWGANVQHKYTCSKCHSPHNGSALPRLMVTNCLDSRHKGRVANASPVLSGVNADDHYESEGPGWGTGSGRIPGSFSGTWWGSHLTTCHENRTGSGTDQSWNTKTLWVNNPPTVPTLVDEPNTTSTSVTLEYSTTDPEGDAIEYYVAIDDASNFSSPNYNSGWISGTSFTLTVGNNSAWYWRVKARDAHNESGWATADSFMVSDGAAPGQVTLASPASGAKITNYPSDVTFTWNAQPALAEYRLWIDDESGFTSPYVYDSGWINTTNQTANITTVGTYYWRVQARDPASYATGTVSATRNIVVNKAPSVPALTPEPDTTAFGITLEWTAATDPEGDTPVQYYVEVDDASNFSSPNYVMNWSTGTSYSFTGTNNIWYWRVKAKDSLNIESVWSSADSFDLYIPGAPAAPTLSWPPDGYWGQVGYPAGEYPLQWNASSGATEYYCEYWGAGTGNSGWTVATSFNPGDLSDNNYYSWRVKARNASGESGWSVIRSWYDYWDAGSCPFVYVWDGGKYDYVTDLQGAPIGYLPSSYLARFVPYFRPLYVVLDNLKPDELGTYNIKLRETLPEISYVDEAKLVAVDFPAGYELVSSTAEMTYRFNYADPFKLYAIKAPRQPVSAVDKNGSDVLASALETDGDLLAMELFALDSYTFDFGSLSPANAKLVIDGWSVFGSTYATALAKVQPYIEVVDANGQWVKVKSFGQPSGDMERMAIDLSGMFLSDDYRVRVHTGRDSGMAWRIDKVMLDDSPPVELTTNEINADYADLHFRGKATYSPSTLEHRITAEDDALPASQKAYGYGKFTKYGDVKALLASADDMYTIMRHGDEISLTFSDPLEPVPEGMKRMYILKADVYYKVFRVNKQVEPLPFHEMSIYPYDTAAENYPADAEHLEYRETYNTREFVE